MGPAKRDDQAQKSGSDRKDAQGDPGIPQIPNLTLPKDGPMQAFNADIQLVERLDVSVLITGESDAETEDIARLVHSRSHRRDAPFVTIHCGGVSAAQLESDLLGDAHRPRARRGNTGRLQQADRGSLLMVDVGAIGRPLQEGLLRFLITGAFHFAERPPRIVDVRIIATTTGSLFERVVSGGFCDDLYYRLNVIHISVPSFTDRGEDIIVNQQRRSSGRAADRSAVMTLPQTYDSRS
jgi:DNA-binding NtrC family response regulator